MPSVSGTSALAAVPWPTGNEFVRFHLSAVMHQAEQGIRHGTPMTTTCLCICNDRKKQIFFASPSLSFFVKRKKVKLQKGPKQNPGEALDVFPVVAHRVLPSWPGASCHEPLGTKTNLEDQRGEF